MVIFHSYVSYYQRVSAPWILWYYEAYQAMIRHLVILIPGARLEGTQKSCEKKSTNRYRDPCSTEKKTSKI